jgi:hypothetical protein
MEQSVNQIFRSIQSIPLYIDPQFPGVDPVDLDLQFTPAFLDLNPQESVLLWSHAEIKNEQEVEDLNLTILGSPYLETSPYPLDNTADFSFHLQLNVFNALLNEVWRNGLLTLDLPPDSNPLVSSGTLYAPSPPILIENRSGSEYPMRLELGGLKLGLIGILTPEEDLFELTLTVGVTLDIDGGQFSLRFEEEPTLLVDIINQRNERLVLDPMIIYRFILTSIWPLLSETLQDNIRLGIDSFQLSTNDLNQLGISVSQALITPYFLPEIHINQGWISLFGGIEGRLVQSP